MKVIANGVEVPIGNSLTISVTLDGDEILPPTSVTVVGGTLTVDRSKVATTGVNLNLFGSKKTDNPCDE